MKIQFCIILLFVIGKPHLFAQNHDSLPVKNPVAENRPLRFNLNESGTHYFQAAVLNQLWVRYNESNAGTTLFSKNAPSTFDIGLRRTRVQLFGQVTDKTFLYFQFGQNNYNATNNYTGNRKIAAFFHDALCEYKVFKNNALKVGGGLTIMNGLSRFSQPSVSTIMTMDVPVFLQYSVDQIDIFDRRLAVYARGQISKFDYRFYLADAFPVNSNGSQVAAISRNASFVNATVPGSQYGNKQTGTYLAWNFFENENHVTPYMTGTYLGNKKVWNIAAGAVHQKSATWYLRENTQGVLTDTTYSDLLLWCVETYLDMPVKRHKGHAINFHAGYYNTNYGHNYLRYNGQMNPATGSTATNLVQPGAFGNAYPMFGSGEILYGQFGYLMPINSSRADRGSLMPYVSAQFSKYNALKKNMLVTRVGINWLIKDHQSKISVDIETRPTYFMNTTNEVVSGKRKNAITLQYQIAL